MSGTRAPESSDFVSKIPGSRLLSSPCLHLWSTTCLCCQLVRGDIGAGWGGTPPQWNRELDQCSASVRQTGTECTQGDINPAPLPPALKWVPLQLLSLALLLEYPLLQESRMLPGSGNQVTQELRFGHRLWQNKLKHSSGYLSFQHQVQLLSQFIIRGKWGRIWKQLICESKGV